VETDIAVGAGQVADGIVVDIASVAAAAGIESY